MAVQFRDILNASAFKLSFEKLGELKFWPITASNFSELQNVLTNPENLTPRDLVFELVLLVGTRINPKDERDRGAPIKRSELKKITDGDVERFSKEYVLTHPELIFRDSTKARGLSKSERLRKADFPKSHDETFMQYLARLLDGYSKRQIESMTKALSSFSNTYRDLFAENERLSKRIGFDVEKFIHESPSPAVFRNPGLSQLTEVVGAIEKLVQLNQESVLLVASLNDLQRQSGLEFATNARQSDRNAKIAIVLAVLSLIVGTVFSGISLYENNKLSKQNEVLIQKLIEQNNLLRSNQ